MIFFYDLAADGRKHRVKLREARNFEKYAFLQCALFPVQEAHVCGIVSQTTCIFGPSTRCFI